LKDLKDVVAVPGSTISWNRIFRAGVGGKKLANIQATKAQTLATGQSRLPNANSAGALLAGMELKVCHPVNCWTRLTDRAGMYEEKSDE